MKNLGRAGAGAERIVRVPLPAKLIEDVDHLVLSGAGAFETRADFIREAVEAYVLEQKYDAAEGEGGPTPPNRLRALPSVFSPASKPESASSFLSDAPRSMTFSSTALQIERKPVVLADGVALVADQPLFGLHNRDFASLWAAFQVSSLTVDGPVEFEVCVDQVTSRAWDFGRLLIALDSQSTSKVSALFPTNPDKVDAAESAFRSFAIGGYVQKDAHVRASGPLFQWSICQLRLGPKGKVLIGVTPQGLDMLYAMAGITAEIPHAEPFARSFVSHLKRYATSDWWGFEAALTSARGHSSRDEMIAAFQRLRSDWTREQAASYSAGYVARAREWGLIEQKQSGGKYSLTPFGETLYQSTKGSAE